MIKIRRASKVLSKIIKFRENLKEKEIGSTFSTFLFIFILVSVILSTPTHTKIPYKPIFSHIFKRYSIVNPLSTESFFYFILYVEKNILEYSRASQFLVCEKFLLKFTFLVEIIKVSFLCVSNFRKYSKDDKKDGRKTKASPFSLHALA